MTHTTQEKEKRKLLIRLRRIRGQIDAVERRIQEDANCAAILQQATACRGALDGFIAEVVEDHILEHMIDPEFFEVGASGRRYGRDYVLDLLEKRFEDPAVNRWETSDFHCIELARDTYLVTYTLLQHKQRVTRRCSIWRRSGQGWQILYHQGTVVAED